MYNCADGTVQFPTTLLYNSPGQGCTTAALYSVQHIVKTGEFFDDYFWSKAFILYKVFFFYVYKAEKRPIFNKFSACFVLNNAIIYVCDRYIIWDNNC